jgi:hypothetical protein
MCPISLKANYDGKFGDKRLAKRAEQISGMLLSGRTSSIHSISKSEAEQRGCYRFLDNDCVEETQLIEAETQRCHQVVGERDVLIIQDSTVFDYSRHRNSLENSGGIGPIGNHKGIGFIGHVSLVVDMRQRILLGISDLQLWHREHKSSISGAKAYKNLPINEKESGKWMRGCEQSKLLLDQARSITFIEDREGDIYEQFAVIGDERTNLIIRSRENRRLSNGEKLYEAISKKSIAGTYTVSITKDIRKKTKTREALLAIRFSEVEITRPNNKHYNHLAKTLKIYVVDAQEIATGPGKPIRWTILTTNAVRCYEEALDVIEKYEQRWYIEQLFRLLKQKGFRIEDSQLKSGWALRKLTVMVMNAAIRVLQMLLAYESEAEQDINDVFTLPEQECLEVLNKKMETKVLGNPHKKQTLKWGVWIIARLAGWKANNKSRPPGPITLKKGVDKFISIYEGWRLARDVS